MKIRTLIKKLEKIEEKHGNIEVFMYTEDGPYDTNSVQVEVSDGSYPSYYNIPEGLKFAWIGS